MAYNLVTGEPSLTGYVPPQRSIQVGQPAEPQRPEPMAERGPAERPTVNQELGGVAGANPTASYRRFEMDGGEGTMGQHWGEAGATE